MRLFLVKLIIILNLAACRQSQIKTQNSTVLITEILNKLLTNYSKAIHPTFNMGSPTVIKTNMNIKSIGPISSSEMTYTMDVYFRQEWKDPRLAFKSPYKQITLSIKMLEQIWKPDTYFSNGRESYLHKIPTTNKLLRISRDGSILYSSRLTIKAACPMNLREFPMDRQTCPLWIGSFSYSMNEIGYQWGTLLKLAVDWKPVQIDRKMKLSQFDLIGTNWNGTRIVKKNNFDQKFIGMEIQLKRHKGFYVLQIYIPSTMLVILSWISFFLNREATADRSGIGIMCILSLATLSFDIRKDIPNVYYGTALDWFIIMCYFFLLASMTQFSIVHYFTKFGFGDLYIAKNPDEFDLDKSQVSLSSIEIPENKSNRMRSFKSYVSDFVKCMMSDQNYKKQMASRAKHKGVNSVSQCDKFARIFFPCFFIFLNIIYWLRYSG